MKDFFDAVFYINLDARTDRRSSIEKQAGEIGLVIERVPGIVIADDDPALQHPIHRNDAKIQRKLGCTRAHISAVRRAKERGYRDVLIVEDDIEFRPGFVPKLKQVYAEVQQHDWHLLYLSGEPNCEVQTVSANVAYIRGGFYGTTAYAVNNTWFDRYLAIDPVVTESIDIRLLNMSEDYRRVYLSREMLCHQLDNHYSDVDGQIRSSAHIHQAAWDRYVTNTGFR